MDILTKVGVLNVFIMIFLSCVNSAKEDIRTQLLIDFKETLLEIDVNPKEDIEIISTKASRWFVPKHISEFNNIFPTNRSLLIRSINGTLKGIVGNVSVCPHFVTNTRLLTIFEIPDCCPCCAWYYEDLCRSYYKKIENCTTIILYSPMNLENQLMHVVTYDNVLFRLPCLMHRKNFQNDLEIKDWIYNIEYLNYKNGSLTTKRANFNYNPTVGLCFNTSEIKVINSYFECNYNDIHLNFFLKKYDFSTESILSSLALVDDNSRQLLLNDTTIKILHNTTIRLRCKAKYTFEQNPNVIMCMKFTVINNISSGYNCSKFNEYFVNELVIHSQQIQNGSKVKCYTVNPSREISENKEIVVYKYDRELLSIKNPQYWKDRVFKIFINDTMHELKISYHVIPSNDPITCSYTEHITLNLKINCTTKMLEQCHCLIITDKLLERKMNVSLTISIFNNRFRENITVLLMPVYVEIPKVTGLTSKMEDQKAISCVFEASQPYNVAWDVEYNGYERKRYLTFSPVLHISLNNNTNSVCVSCAVTNEAGNRRSDKVCKRILDIDMHFNNSVQIFLINTTIWNNGLENKDVLSFSGPKDTAITILDTVSTSIMCASQIRNETIELYFNDTAINPLRNGKQIQTLYTLQKYVSVNFTFLVTVRDPVKYFCRQNDRFDETYYIRALQTTVPRIQLFEEKSQFLIGQNVQFTIGIISFPPARVKIYRAIFVEKNNTYRYMSLGLRKFKITKVFGNFSITKFEMVIYNFSRVDSGKYLIHAQNARGEDSYLFPLEPWTMPTQYVKVYIFLGSLIAFVVICLILVVIYCKRTGYAIPIIQIQNNMYKSLDGDSMQILSTIWPDPLERTRWTIKPSSRIKVKERIGGGNYGIVYTGTLKQQDLSEECVALKYPILSKPTNNNKPSGPTQFCQISLDCFINEVRILSLLSNCPNIIKMYGCVILREWINEKDGIKEPTTMAVLEFCSNYSLSEFLSKNAQFFAPYTRHRKFTLPNGYTGMKLDEGITLLDLKRIALGISTGLQYLSGLNIIHRDLATRNILIDDMKNPKICDFGLAIELDTEFLNSNSYHILTYNKALPYKILAPEALESKIFYLESDIWSFSLLLWEIFNLDKVVLFPNINSPGELIRYINSKICDNRSNELLPMPRYADESIWELIKSCWVLNPFQRPGANLIHGKLVEIVRNSPVEVIRVSSSSQSDIYDYSGRKSVGSSKFPSARTSIITLNFPSNASDNNSNDELGHLNLIDESLL